jgi:small subunit ribosomal protein S8
MAMTDPIADYLTRIRNAQMAGHRMVEISSSKMKRAITEILYDQGFIHRYKFVDAEAGQGKIMIALKYDPSSKEPVIRKLQRASKPGLRMYEGADSLPRVNNGLGIAIVSTSQGVMTAKKAQQAHIGGEVICYIS